VTIEDPSSVVLADHADGVTTLTFNRPERLNAWNFEMEEHYFDLLDAADADPDVRVVVVTGSGKGFCPGMDIEVLDGLAAGAPLPDRARPLSHALTVRKPLIAAINGACAGLGFYQAVACDVRFAAAGAKLTTSFVRRGLPAEVGLSWLLPRLIGQGRAADLLLSGRTFTAEDALAMGLVSAVYPDEELLPAVLAYARDVATNCSPIAVATIKRQITADWTAGLESSEAEAHDLVEDMLRGPDFPEGLASFRKRRPPVFPPLSPRSSRH
jgi:enoyl-CoA hydratase/carnithine racemase